MSFDWADYLTLARFLVGDGDYETPSLESRFRCAASRAYYAALCQAAAYLSNIIGEAPPEDYKFHEFVISYFRDAEERSWRRIGSRLEELREYRRYADYNPTIGDWLKKATASITRCEQAIQDMEASFNGPPVL
jgi:hypothetical protein